MVGLQGGVFVSKNRFALLLASTLLIPQVSLGNDSTVGIGSSPASGSCFPLGTATVTCTATDTSGKMATCSFTVTTFDVCLQDDATPATVLLFNSQSGDYRFCCNGTVFTGKGTVITKGSVITLQHNTTDRRVQATVDLSVFKGSAAFQSPPGTTRCTITDRDLRNNACNCP